MFFRTLLHSPLSKIIITTTIIVTIKIITLKKYMFVNRIKILLGYEIELIARRFSFVELSPLAFTI